MNLFQKCVCFLVVTASMDCIGVTSGCTTDDILKCNSHATELSASMTDETTVDLNVACQTMKDMSDCFDRLLDGCSPSMRQVIDTALSQFDQMHQMCQPGSDGSTLCTPDDIMDCVNPLMNMSTSDMMDPAKSCPKTLNAVDCLEKEIETCPEFLQNQLEAQLDQLAASRSICEQFTNVDNPVGPGCSGDKIMMCMGPAQTLTPEQKKELDVVCPMTKAAIACMTKEMNACPDSMKSLFQGPLAGLQSGHDLCKNYWSSGSGLKSSFWILWAAAMLIVLRHFL